jgi:hypothetical protein
MPEGGEPKQTSQQQRIEKLCTHVYISFYYYHWVDTTAGGLLVPDGIIRPVVSASAQTWFIKYIYY